MSYTFLITRDRYEEPLLEIKIKEEIIECDPLVHSHLERCFERIFQLIKPVKKEEKKEEEEVVVVDTEAEEDEKNFFSTIFN